MTKPVLKAIYKRRSVREFNNESVKIEDLREIVKAGSWAPSGLNNQPWRFVLITDTETKSQLADQTRYGHVIRGAPALIAVFLAIEDIYNEVKDHQATGACIQNMLLAAEELGLGAVWLGEILNRKDQVNRIIEVGDDYDLMAIVAVGHPVDRSRGSKRKELNSLIIKEILEDS
ncbi:MAG: nitroreductase family protein [Desulfurivibrionaceae bacterium]|nr:nitroreductase family protein [Desulfobulbales bacterium]MDT8334292.1 nitroreductase family protein [Desulfurivibrionaceae bacterium]